MTTYIAADPFSIAAVIARKRGRQLLALRQGCLRQEMSGRPWPQGFSVFSACFADGGP